MKNPLHAKSLISVESLTKSDVDLIFQKADEMKKLVNIHGGDDRLKGRIMATLFYEPSSRTFGSFITAMQRLGGGFIPLSNMAQSTSVSKGETIEDTARVFSSYADIIVMRNAEVGTVDQLAEYASVPVINAGDGINEHPTQALLDLYTIHEVFGRCDDLTIVMIGDLAHYRPVNSLAKILCLYSNTTIRFVSPKEVAIQDSLRTYLKKHNVSIEEYEKFEGSIADADVVYVTRVKKEYMSEELYHQVQGSYVFDAKAVGTMKKKSIVMHPLPRVGEIHVDVDNDARAVYFTKQLKNGMYVRMAILDLILKNE